MAKPETELLEGSQVRVTPAVGDSMKENLLKRIWRKICQREKTVHFNSGGGCINLNFYNINKEEIAQLFMDNHGQINS